ncbi:MAG: isoprenylcysteine carboxylmethyltransferase family protein [Bacteroidales bacterium]|nr:isoprenylcysteine carboxylmethyltransferase family protein [Bacteroidales bacterium]
MAEKKSELPQPEMKFLITKIIMRFSLVPIVIGLLILIPSGTFWFWQVYLYLTILLVPMIFVLFYFLKNDPMFLERRTRAKEKEKEQIIIQVIFSFIFLSGFVIPGMDKRFGWSHVPVLVVITADVVILLGYLLIFAVFKQNSYASRVVEVEKDQKVISTGLYGIVRHPMYIGVIIMFVPSPIALGSYWGMIPMTTIPLALVLRIINEEKVLRKELPGYKDYCQKTKYRLIPYVW